MESSLEHVCTLVWLDRPNRLTLWHSRDERRSRGTALPPAVGYGNRVAWVSPRDTEAGGTWVGANTHGVVVGLANLFISREPVPPAGKVSRGLLVQSLLDSPTSGQVQRRMLALDLARFEPFTLVSVESGAPPVILQWDRRTLSPMEPAGGALLVTSAGGNRQVEAGRADLFREPEMTPAQVEAFYRARPVDGQVSVCVHLPEVSTVSLTRIDITPRQVLLAYTPGPPCETPAGPAVMLDRIDSPSP